MTDITLKTINSGYNLNKINDNFVTLEDNINNTSIQSTGGNNVMSQDFDMNSKRMINLPAPVSGSEPIRKGDITASTTGATVQYVDDSIEAATINDLSQAYDFPTRQLMIDSAIIFPAGKRLHVIDINANYVKSIGSSLQPVGSPDLAGGGYAELKEQSPYRLSLFGAIDGQDSTAAIQAAIDEKGTIDVDGDYLFSSSLAVDRADITIIGSGSLAGTNRSSAITYSDLVKNLILKDFTLKTCAGTQTINSLTSAIDFVRVTNITIDDTEIGIHLLGAVKNAVFRDNTFNNLHRTLLDQSCQGIKIGNNNRATALETKKVSIVDNHFTNIVNDFNKETHAFIVYGREVVATGNIAEGVTHAAAVACETYYFKADIVTCTGNTVLNQGVANDGCINFKGGPEGDVAQVTGQRITCTGNTIVNEDLSLSIIGISCTDEKATITGNTLVNTWFRAFSGDDILFANNTVNITRSEGSITWFEVENASNVTIRGNTVNIVANNFGSGGGINTVQAARVRASAGAIERFKMIDNTIDISYPDLIDGDNTVSSLELWAENFDISSVDIRDNEVTISAPNIGSQLDRQLVSFSGNTDVVPIETTISGKVRRNEIPVDLIYFRGNAPLIADITFSENTVNNVELTTANKGFEQRVSDTTVRMPLADANRTVFLPRAIPGISMRLLNDSPSFTMTMTVDATAPADSFVDATISKILSVGASASVRCFTADVWVIESQSGVIT